jgi:membrane associated rhomboid family serine protease
MTEPELEPEKPPRSVQWLGRLLGLTPTQIEWRWRKFRTRTSSYKSTSSSKISTSTVSSTRSGPTQAVMCQHCASAQSSDDLRCSACGKQMISRVARSVRAMGMEIPSVLSSTVIIASVCIAIYVMMLIQYPGSGLSAWKNSELLAHGALLHEDGFSVQPWRMGTACLLHIGVMHLAMNMLSLASIGPMVESMFGRGRTLFLFMVTGVAANVASLLLMSHSVSAGASGAIMGLIGVAAGVGHRLPEGRGREIRNHMLRWAGITVVLGFAIHADNAAHVGGFVVGGLVGIALPPDRVVRSIKSGSSACLGAIGALLLGVTAALAFARHPTPGYLEPRLQAAIAFRTHTNRACQRLDSEPEHSSEIAKQYSAALDTDTSVLQLQATCEFVKKIAPRCAAYRARGSQVFTDDERAAAIVDTTYDYFNVWCASNESGN